MRGSPRSSVPQGVAPLCAPPRRAHAPFDPAPWPRQEKKPTTRQLLGWLSPRFDMPVRLGALLLFPWRLFTTQLRKLFGLIRSLFRGADPDSPLAPETSP